MDRSTLIAVAVIMGTVIIVLVGFVVVLLLVVAKQYNFCKRNGKSSSTFRGRNTLSCETILQKLLLFPSGVRLFLKGSNVLQFGGKLFSCIVYPFSKVAYGAKKKKQEITKCVSFFGNDEKLETVSFI